MSKVKRARIKDVASLAQTSVATASRVLSNSEYPVSEELRLKVEAAARELSFVPNHSVLPGSRVSTGNIGLIVPTLSNPYYTQTIEGISAVCFEKGFGLLLCDSQNSPQLEERMLSDLRARKVKGLIISSLKEDGAILSALISQGICAVQLDQHFDGQVCDSIRFDTKRGARIAVRHLYEKGHRRIGFASKPLTRWTRRQTYQGYLEELERLGLPADDSLVFISDCYEETERNSYGSEIGSSLAKRFSEADCGATAVFCVNDIVAFGLIHGFKQQGIRVPEDVSVMGFDDIPLSSVFVPALTTIHCPSYETGRLAALMLIDRIQNGEVSSFGAAINMNLQPRLVERESVKDLNIKQQATITKLGGKNV